MQKIFYILEVLFKYAIYANILINVNCYGYSIIENYGEVLIRYKFKPKANRLVINVNLYCFHENFNQILLHLSFKKWTSIFRLNQHRFIYWAKEMPIYRFKWFKPIILTSSLINILEKIWKQSIGSCYNSYIIN